MLTGYEGRFILDVVLSLIAGFLIGGERELKGKDAGVSTVTLVITGSMLFTFLSSIVDPASKSRIAAQVITGIGFLGAGMIFKREGGKVENLTTAATVWFSGAIGMAFGFDFHLIGILATLVCVGIIAIPKIREKDRKAEEKRKAGTKRG